MRSSRNGCVKPGVRETWTLYSFTFVFVFQANVSARLRGLLMSWRLRAAGLADRMDDVARRRVRAPSSGRRPRAPAPCRDRCRSSWCS